MTYANALLTLVELAEQSVTTIADRVVLYDCAAIALEPVCKDRAEAAKAAAGALREAEAAQFQFREILKTAQSTVPHNGDAR